MTYFERIANINRRRTSYGISGLSYYDLMDQADLQNCSARDSACVANNAAKQAAVEDFWINNGMKTSSGVPVGTKLTFTPLSDSEVKEFYNPGDLVNGGNVIDSRHVLAVNNTPYTPTEYRAGGTQVTVYNPTVKFQASRAGSKFMVGDTWSISITGAKPGSKVSADGTQFGVIDSSGKWNLSGTFETSTVGDWNEHWALDGVIVATWAFNVAIPQSVSQTGDVTVINTTNDSTNVIPTNISSWFTESMFGGVPNWALVAGGVVAVGMMFGGKR